MTLTPAYGRDYKSKAAALADFDDNTDFIINDAFSPWDGKPVNKAQLSGQKVTIRYSNLKKVFVVQVK